MALKGSEVVAARAIDVNHIPILEFVKPHADPPNARELVL
jgi:hypothetical protein